MFIPLKVLIIWYKKVEKINTGPLLLYPFSQETSITSTSDNKQDVSYLRLPELKWNGSYIHCLK